MALPNEIHPLALGTSSSYKISRSLRFNSADSAYLNRTPASSGNRQKWTWSGWIKRGRPIVFIPLVQYSDGTNQSSIQLRGTGDGDDDKIRFYDLTGNVFAANIFWTPVFRDYSAWYHIILVIDTTQATNTDRIKLYVNGVQITSTSSATWPSLNANLRVNQNAAHFIGQSGAGTGFSDGYMTEINFIDGQALTPSSFGQTDSSTGVWVPKKYAGTYGTNGFYLNFSDNSNTTSGTLGKDYSGNSNDWTPNNFSVTAGAGNDSLTDTPTPYGNDTGAGGEVRGNYATLNPLDVSASILSNGNLDITFATNSDTNRGGTIAVSTGKWYFEATVQAVGGTYAIIGVTSGVATASSLGTTAYQYSYISSTGNKFNNNSATAYGNTYTTSDVIGVALDMDNGKVWFSKNGTWQSSGDPAAGTNQAFSGLSGSFSPAINARNNSIVNLNCGQRPFTYTAPSGFKALNTQNLPVPTIKKPNQFFNAVTWTGTGATRSITGVGFQPDLVWSKSRSNAETHKLVDAVRGATKALSSETTGDEVTESGITSFNSDGFTIDGATDTGYNTNTYTYVGWNWKEGVTPGFDIVTYTGNGSARTISHSLGAVPHFMIVKARTTAGSDQGWPVYHANNTAAPETDYLVLNTTAATADNSTLWNDTAPTTTVFSVGTDNFVNQTSDPYVAYLWAEVEGFSKFGRYTGNGSADGPFVFCGFRPRFVYVKRTDSTGDWWTYDTIRSNANASINKLLLNTNALEDTSGEDIDILSNGFKIRTTAAGINTSTATYIFAAFAETPFKYALAR